MNAYRQTASIIAAAVAVGAINAEAASPTQTSESVCFNGTGTVLRATVSAGETNGPACAEATILHVSAAQRWPFAGLVDIDYTLETFPEGTLANISVSARDEDLAQSLSMSSISGDGANGPIPSGSHRLTWDLAADHPGFHSSELTIDVSAVPVYLPPPIGLSATEYMESILISWTTVDGATSYEVWRNTLDATGSATKIASPTATSYSDTTAGGGTNYYYWVKAVCANSTSAFSTVVGPKGLVFDAPSGVAASATTASIALSWTAATGAASYEVYRATSDSFAAAATPFATGMATSYSDTSATPGTRYYYRVKAKYEKGTSAYSTPTVSAVRPLSAPANLTGTGSYSAIALSWSASTGATSYEVWRNASNATGSATKIASPTATSYSDTTAGGGTNYYYWVKAVCANSTSAFSTVVGPKGLVFNAPSGIAASATTASIALSWTAATGAASYEVWRSTSNASGSATKLASPTAASYADTSAVPGTKYYYWVKAVYAKGTSDFSNIYGPVVRPLSSPANLTGTGSYSAIALSWSASTGATSYEVWRCTSNDPSSASKIGTTTTTSYSDSGVVANTDYYYWVKAVCANSTSAFSTVVGPKGLVFDAPTGLGASATTAGITLTWTAATGATSYEVWRGLSNASGSATKLASPTAASYTDTGAVPGTQYYYWVKAVYAKGTSAFSNIYGPVVRPLSPPENLVATGSTANIALSWSASAGATSYEVWRNTSNDSMNAERITTVTGTIAYDLSPQPGIRYYYWTKAIGENSSSDFSLSSNAMRQLSPPTNVSASNSTKGTRISWEESFGAMVYHVWRSTTDNQSAATDIATTSNNYYTDAGEAGTKFYYWITAGANYYGEVSNSDYSNPVEGVRELLPPNNVKATGSTASIALSWSVSTGATSYEIWRSTSNATASATKRGSSTATSYTDTSATIGTNYYYWVKAVCANSTSDFSTGANAFRKISPPTGVTAIAGSSLTNIVVSWSAAVSGAKQYEIWRATYTQTSGGSVTASSAMSRIATINARTVTGSQVKSYSDYPSLSSGNKFYRYQVKAVGESDTSQPSNYSEVRTYKNAGSYSLTLPKTTKYTLRAVGGGGGGAYCGLASTGNSNIHAGGGSGGAFDGVLTLSSGSYALVVGGGGAKKSGMWNASASDGEATTLSKSGSMAFSAGGGGGGTVNGYTGTKKGGAGGTVTASAIVSSTLNSGGQSGATKSNAVATGGASVLGGYGAGGSSGRDGGTGFFQITITE